MRLILLICGAALLGACASTPPAAAPSSTAVISELPKSQLAPGQCGLFGWATGDTRDFIFYADQKTARYASLSGPLDLTAQSVFPSTDYTDPSGNPVTLRLGTGEVMDGGMRYPAARVVSLTDEGWEAPAPGRDCANLPASLR